MLLIPFLFAANLSFAADPAPAKPASQRELWVPTEHLQSVLKKMPRAVMLTAEQYESLLKDSQLAIPNPNSKAKPKPPVQVVIREAAFSGEIKIGSDVVLMTANYVVESFSDDWAEIPLSLPRTRLAHIEVDAKSALRVPPPAKGKSPHPILVVKGRGKHSVQAVYHLPVKRSPTGNSIAITSPGTAAAALTLTIPEGAELDSALPFVITDVSSEYDPPEILNSVGSTSEEVSIPAPEPIPSSPTAFTKSNTATFVLPARAGANFEIRWTARNVAEIPDAAVFQNCQYLYSIDSTRVQADLGLVLNSNLTKLPNRYEISIPEDVRVLSVEGSELLRWTRLEGGAVEVVLVPGERDVTDLRVLAESDVAIPDGAESATISLPFVDLKGVHRASGTMALIGSDDVRVKNIATGPLTAPIPDDIEGAIANHPHYVAAFRFPVATESPEVTLSKIGEKFKAQLDTLVKLERESVQLVRTLNVIPDEGRTFEIEFSLPTGEELLDVKASGNRTDFSWVRGDGNTIRLLWKAGLAAGGGDTLTIDSRRDPEGWFGLGDQPMALDFETATIDGAEALSGYVAVSFDDSFRVETVTADGLDPRDGRTTPIKGTLAWFRLTDYSLTLNTSRRATEIEAVHTAYALPLASNLEIEGQIVLAIRYTPMGQLAIEFPTDVAAQARFDSPLIAQKNLDEETGIWTLDFHDELIGSQRLRYRMSLPFEVEEVEKDSEQKRFEIALPVVKIPAAKRLRGEWVMEANTDTELNFEASGLDAVDSLRVPQIAGYQPRHRVIAAYQYRGDAWSLKLAGTRHAHEDLVSTVIDSLRLDTVVSTDGDDRHQAQMSLRTTGEQFLEIGLPKEAVLWTLKVDGKTVKPVRSKPGTLRVQLPAHENAGNRAISLKVIYQTPGKKWSGSGTEKLQSIRIADRIPVMKTQWFLHLPEGYDYQKFESNLSEEFEVVDRTLLGYAGDEFGDMMSRPMPASVFAKSERATETAGSAPMAKNAAVATDSEDYYETARSQTRATFMNDIAQGWEMPEAESAGGLSDQELESRLKTIILPSIEFKDTPLSDALAFLQQRSMELDTAVADPAKKGINFLLVPNAAPSANNAPEPAAANTPPGGGPGDTKITLRLSNVPLVEALRYTTSLAGMKYQIQNGRVAVVPMHHPEPPEPTEIRRYQLPSDFLAKAHAEMYPNADANQPNNPFAGDTPTQNQPVRPPATARSLFESAGITFPQGSFADFNPNTGELKVGNTSDQLELVELYLDHLSGGNLNAESQFEEDMEAADSQTDMVSVNEQKLKNIILPNVEFVDTPLSEALTYLQQRSVELDANETDPSKKGMNFILDSGAIGAAPAPAPSTQNGEPGNRQSVADTKITLRLSNVPLVEALRYTTSLAQMKYKVEPNAIVIVPLSRPDQDLYTNTYTVPPTFLSAAPAMNQPQAAAADPFADPAAAGGGGGLSARASARGLLESAGVTFPPGGFATYNPRTNQLIVRTTQDQMELVELYQDSIKATLSDQAESEAAGGFKITRLPDSQSETNQIGNGQRDAVTQFFGNKIADQFNPEWRDVPVLGDVPVVGRLFQQGEQAAIGNEKALNEIVIDDLDLSGKTVEEALGAIRAKALTEAGPSTVSGGGSFATSRSKLVKFTYRDDKKKEPSGVDPAIKNKLDLKLSNVTVIEALEKISEASDTHFRITPDGIAIAPKAVPLEPMQTVFIELPATEFQTSDGNGGVRPVHARNILVKAGIKFPVGSSAAYNPSTGRLAVRNTRENLEAVASHFAAFLNVEAQQAHAADRAEVFKREFLGGAADLKGFNLADIGRLPIDFVLPESGRSYSFSGLYAPDTIEFRFVNWERQIRFAWIWILIGGLAFWFGAYRRLGKPVFLGLLGIILLTFLPLVISKSILAVCNAILIGWIAAGVIWICWKWAGAESPKSEEVAG